MLPIQYKASFTSGNSHSDAVHYRETFEWISLRVPSTSGVIGADEPIYVETSMDGETFYRSTAAELQTQVVGGNDLRVKSGVSLRAIPLPHVGGDYMRIALSAGVEANGDIEIVFVGDKTR